MRSVFNALTDLYQAVPALKTQIDANKSSVSSVKDTVTNITTNTETIVQQAAPNTGFVNSQVGVTAYVTAQADYGKLIVLNDASAIAVTLSTTVGGISLPFYCRVLNLGAGTATLTPVSGLIYSAVAPSGAANYALTTGNSIGIWFDGTNFYAS